MQPSADLAARRDLFEYQLTKPLDHNEWEALVRPQKTTDKIAFQSVHNNFIELYKSHIKTHDPKVLFGMALPATCVNRTIYNLCLINRVRYELNYPLMRAEESDWIDFLVFTNDPQFKLMLDFWLKERLVND